MVVTVSPFMTVMIAFVDRSMISVTVLERMFSAPVSDPMAITVFGVMMASMIIAVVIKARPFPIISAFPVFTADVFVFYLIIIPFFWVIRPGSTGG